MVFESFVGHAQHFIIHFSYLGIFIISGLANATIFVGIPGLSYVIIIFAIGLGLNPLLVGIFAGVGSATGELTGYFLGLGGEVAIEKYKEKTPKLIKKMMDFFKNIGFLFVMIVAALPFPFDIIGIMSGIAKYDLKKFYLATIIGRVVRSLLIAYGIYEIYMLFD
jgi:membrane protein YqaA with SNARE-associated domain